MSLISFELLFLTAVKTRVEGKKIQVPFTIFSKEYRYLLNYIFPFLELCLPSIQVKIVSGYLPVIRLHGNCDFHPKEKPQKTMVLRGFILTMGH